MTDPKDLPVPGGHAMIDIETLGTGPDAAVLSVGAVAFTVKGDVDEEGGFHAVLDVQGQMDLGASVTGSTVRWWMEQSREARAAAFGKGAHFATALGALTSWLTSKFREPDYCVWAFGPQFDLVILKNLYCLCGQVTPWSYRQERDVRTALMLDGLHRLERPDRLTRHNAFCDAVFQAMMVRRFLGSCAPAYHRPGPYLNRTAFVTIPAPVEAFSAPRDTLQELIDADLTGGCDELLG